MNNIEQLAVPEGWISVKDRLPDHGTNVLCAVSSEAESFIAAYDATEGNGASKEWFRVTPNSKGWEICDVDVWQPLPAFPTPPILQEPTEAELKQMEFDSYAMPPTGGVG